MKDQPKSELRAIGRISIDAVKGVTDIVEALHRNIARVSPIVGTAPADRARGIAGFVYRSVRGVTNVVGVGLDAALTRLVPLMRGRKPSPRGEAIAAALNGVLGDYLAASDNALAITMRLRQAGRPIELNRVALSATIENPSRKLLVMVHGLCMNDLQWMRDGHDHGLSLAQDLGYTPLYLHYNSGRHISENGRDFAAILEHLTQAWPVAVSELVIVGHSMGGLVTRSACHYAKVVRHHWQSRLKKIVFLGTPHHGAPLERAGNWVDVAVGISPYTAPFARLAKLRSAGIQDVRYGNLLDEDWSRQVNDRASKNRKRIARPLGVQCFAIAATNAKRPSPSGTWPRGDGLVPVASALGRHSSAALALPIARSRQQVFCGLNHFDLLSDRRVYDRLRAWLAAR